VEKKWKKWKEKRNGYKGRKMIGGKLRRPMAHMYGNFEPHQHQRNK